MTTHSGSSTKAAKKKDSDTAEARQKTLSKRDSLIFGLIRESGITPREITYLTHGDFDFDKQTLTLRAETTKNKTKRIIQLPISLITEIKIFADSKAPYLFATKKAPQITVRTVQRILDAVSKERGTKQTSVDLRKRFIEEAIRNKPLETVKQEAGIKRLDKRFYLNKKDVEKLRTATTTQREDLIIELLLSGISSTILSTLTEEKANKKNLSSIATKKLKEFVLQTGLRRHEYLFKTRQKTLLTSERILQLTKAIGSKAKLRVTPRILNNTAIADALSSEDPKTQLNKLGLKTRALHLHGGFVTHET